MRDFIAYCGLDCETCEARLATIHNDDALRERVAREWSEMNGVEITPDMINCEGCRVSGVKTPYCESLCPIRLCAVKKGVVTCDSCADAASCEKVKPFCESDAVKIRLFLLNGASSSGKSTIARELHKQIDNSVIISIDDYLTMSADKHVYEDDVYEIMPAMCDDITKSLKDGKIVICDHVITSCRIYDALISAVAGYRMRTVLVTCDIDTLREREAKRGNRCTGSAENSQKYLYPKDNYDLRIDTGTQTIIDIMNDILGRK